MNNLKKKLYQLIINRLDGEKLSSGEYREHCLELVRKGIGGFIIFGGKRNELKKFIAELQSLAEVPLFIASDIERGTGQQIEGGSSFPPQMAVAAAIDKDNKEDTALLENAIKEAACDAMDIGINMPLLPVLDVNQDPDNPIICTRAFSDDPESVAWFGRLYIRVLEESGLLSCAKHFPGHGDTDIDSHISLPVISKPLNELVDIDIFPFREAMKEGVSTIMVGHLSVPAIDELPASFSGKMITGLLRNELGYDGLILTDALNMHALNEFGNVPVACMNAGMDIILHPADPDAVVSELIEAVRSGEVKEGTIDAAFSRILKYKTKIKNIQPPVMEAGRLRELAGIISDNSITLVKAGQGMVPLNDMKNISLVYNGDKDDLDISFLEEAVSGGVFELNSPGSDALKETVVIALFTHIAAWRGSSGIPEKAVSAIKSIIKSSARSIVVSFGSPYLLRHFGDADMLVAAYDSGRQAQASVLKCLKGEKDFKGKLPVSIQV